MDRSADISELAKSYYQDQFNIYVTFLEDCWYRIYITYNEESAKILIKDDYTDREILNVVVQSIETMMLRINRRGD